MVVTFLLLDLNFRVDVDINEAPPAPPAQPAPAPPRPAAPAAAGQEQPLLGAAAGPVED